MNKKMLRRLVGKQCVLYPPVHSIFPPDSAGKRRVLFRNWPWLVTGCMDETLSLQNTTTGHVLPLPLEHVYDFRNNVSSRPPFLVLKSQVWITRSDAGI